jgi:multiple sugar transport system substrate-binding protein
MKRIALAAATALLVTVGVAGCGGTGDSNSGGDASKPAASKPAKLDPAEITLWVGFTQRELGVFKDTVKEFEAQNPGVKVRVVGGINDDKIIAASRGGKAPDVAQSFSADNSGAFCGSGAWVDLKSYMQRDGIKDTIFPPAPRSYTQFEGTRCALPMLADAMGLYYNEDMLKKAVRRRRSPN